jgi:hypothetical protein
MLMKLLQWAKGFILKRKNAEVLVVAGKENGLEVNVYNTKYMATSRDMDARRSNSVKVYNNSFE